MSAVLEIQPSPLPPGPIAGPAAWKGPELAKRREWFYELAAEDLAELDAAIRTHFAEGREMGDLSPATFRLPTLSKKIATLLDQVIHGCGFVMLRGFPVTKYTTAESAVAYLGVGSHFGSFRSQNAKGHLLGHVCDLGLDIRKPTTRYYQTNRELEYHTDSCDIVGLLCLKTSKSGGAEVRYAG
jgi:Taurine catabolism dioxygenase TauD, TfdA family